VQKSKFGENHVRISGRCVLVEKHTHKTVLRLTGFCPDNPGEPVPEETFTYSHLSWSLVIPYLLLPSNMIHGILPVQFTCLSFPQSPFSLVYLLAWHPPLHTPYISSHNHFLLFTAHAHTIATCFAVIPRLCCLIPVSLSTLYLELYFVA